jgi:23S rRNA (pseudouridine1915-N3)-methyltransferase
VIISIYYIGKPKNAHANALADEFIKRTQRYAKCEMREIKPQRFDEVCGRHPSAQKILLDAAGKTWDSARFLDLISTSEDLARDLVFVIGSHDGLPDEWKAKADLLLSLSPMTFPHELARAMLAEQIYRAFATLRGHPYPR